MKFPFRELVSGGKVRNLGDSDSGEVAVVEGFWYWRKPNLGTLLPGTTALAKSPNDTGNAFKLKSPFFQLTFSTTKAISDSPFCPFGIAFALSMRP